MELQSGGKRPTHSSSFLKIFISYIFKKLHMLQLFLPNLFPINIFCCCCCYFFIFWLCQAACEILVPQPGLEPAPSILAAGVLTTGLPGKSLSNYF